MNPFNTIIVTSLLQLDFIYSSVFNHHGMKCLLFAKMKRLKKTHNSNHCLRDHEVFSFCTDLQNQITSFQHATICETWSGLEMKISGVCVLEPCNLKSPAWCEAVTSSSNYLFLPPPIIHLTLHEVWFWFNDLLEQNAKSNE